MRILIPVDGSDASTAAVKFVASRTSLLGTDPEVELLNVQTPIPQSIVRTARAMVRDYHQIEADRVLKPAQAVLKKVGLNASAKYLIGHPGLEVSRAAAKDRTDLIVMGSHGHTALKGLFFGSVTNAVLAASSKPLLLLRGKTAPSTDSLKVGIAVDGSPFGVAAVKYFIKHPALFGKNPSVALIHAVPDMFPSTYQGFAEVPMPSINAKEVEALRAGEFEDAVEAARKLLRKAGITHTERRLDGSDIGDQIASYAKKANLDLLLLGSHGRGLLKSALLGSVATRVAAKCGTPLLLIRRR
jgi:nucleotide-binding universal stress UspA family protein